MSDYYKISKQILTDIADSIRYLNKETTQYAPENFAAILKRLIVLPMGSAISENDLGAILSGNSNANGFIYEIPNNTFVCNETAGGTTLSGTIGVKAGDWILATVTTRSMTTYPEEWTVLRESSVLSSGNSNQRMAFLSYQATEDGDITLTVTQETSARIYINLIAFENINGFAYHEGTEVYSDTPSEAITISRPNYTSLVWACSATTWLTSSPYGLWICDPLYSICLNQLSTAPRQANFIDNDSTLTERTFTNPASSGSAYIVDCVEILQ